MKKGFRKRLFALALALCMICITLPTAFAADTSYNDADPITPRLVGVQDGIVSININSSGRATCYGYVNLKSGYTATLELYLQKYESGAVWTNIKGWSVSGSSELELDKIYYVNPGHKYRTTTIVDVYDSNGKLVETVIEHSGSQTY